MTSFEGLYIASYSKTSSPNERTILKIKNISTYVVLKALPLGPISAFSVLPRLGMTKMWIRTLHCTEEKSQSFSLSLPDFCVAWPLFS